MFALLCVSSEGSRFLPSSSVTPFSNPLWDNLFVFVGTLYAVFIQAKNKKQHPHFNHQMCAY